MSKSKDPASLQVWAEVQRKLHLSDAHVQMARELGMNPKKLGGLANHRQEPWKAPLPEFIEELYERRFRRRRPERVISLKERARELDSKKALRRASRAAHRASEGRRLREANSDGRQTSSPLSRTTMREVAAPEMNVSREAATIVASAVENQARVIAIGPLLFFSTDTGDAWVLDPVEGLARCLARAGAPLPTGIVETPSSFGVDWQASYALEGNAFSVADRGGRVNSIVGYPVDAIRTAVQRMRTG